MFISLCMRMSRGLFRATEIFITNDPVSGGAFFREKYQYTDDGQSISCERLSRNNDRLLCGHSSKVLEVRR